MVFWSLLGSPYVVKHNETTTNTAALRLFAAPDTATEAAAADTTTSPTTTPTPPTIAPREPHKPQQRRHSCSPLPYLFAPAAAPGNVPPLQLPNARQQAGRERESPVLPGGSGRLIWVVVKPKY